MAANSSDRQREPDGLKYLGFFHVAAQKAISRVRSVYNYGKDNSGALKQGIEAVEGAVEVLVSPLYQKIQGKPFEILSYADQKVDDSIATVESKVPTSVKSTAKHVYETAKQASHGTRTLLGDIRENGFVVTAKGVARGFYSKTEPVAKEVYNKYEPVAEQWSLMAWYRLLQFPVVPLVIEALVPPGVYCVQIYNSSIQHLDNRNYKVASYLPNVPAEKLRNSIYRSLEAARYRAAYNVHSGSQMDDSSEQVSGHIPGDHSPGNN